MNLEDVDVGEVRQGVLAIVRILLDLLVGLIGEEAHVAHGAGGLARPAVAPTDPGGQFRWPGGCLMTVDDTVQRILKAPDSVSINQLHSGVRGLDEVLGGGIPEYSFNLIAGAPGHGKTTLSQQIMFALATPERPALHFTVVGEPTFKLLRYQQQFSFFDPTKIGNASPT